jgi:NlpC/P60 family putative phage cell wall peptidase
MSTERGASVVVAARGWIGTPYHHQASLKGAGADCLGLVRGVYREVTGREPERAPAYSRDWGETDGVETLLDAAGRHLVKVSHGGIAPGDVIAFRLRSKTVAKHAAILATPDTMIHAMEGTAAAEVALSKWWRRRLAGAFRFPD